MIDESRLHFHRSNAVSGHVDDVVYAAEEPEVTILVALRAVTCEVDTWPFRPVLLHEAIGISPDAAQHRRPGRCDRKISAADFDTLTTLIEDLRVDAGERARRRT